MAGASKKNGMYRMRVHTTVPRVHFPGNVRTKSDRGNQIKRQRQEATRQHSYLQQGHGPGEALKSLHRRSHLSGLTTTTLDLRKPWVWWRHSKMHFDTPNSRGRSNNNIGVEGAAAQATSRDIQIQLDSTITLEMKVPRRLLSH
jgi:hypothetical protein